MIRKLLLLLLISVFVVPVAAHGWDNRNHFDISGYVGYQFVYGSPAPTPIESGVEVGLLINYDIADHWTAFTQFRLETDYLDQSLAYAFIEYNDVLLESIPFSIAVGKLRHRYGLYNKDRLNPRTRPGNIAPQAIYWDKLRYALTSGWGVSVGSNFGNWDLGYTISIPTVVNEKAESEAWFSGEKNTIETRFGGHQMININYMADNWRIVSGIILQDWGHGDAGKSQILLLGGEKRFGDLTVSIEGMFVMKDIHNSYGLSVSAQYDVSELISTHINYNRYEALIDTGEALIDTSAGDITRTRQYTLQSHDISVGVTISLDEWEVKTEIHAAKGSVWVDYPEGTDPAFADWWHYGAVSVVYHF